MSIDLLIDRMQTMLADIPATDPRRFFHSTYTRTTVAVRDELAAKRFVDNEWVERWDVAFASLYLDALDTWQRGQAPSAPWQVAFDATTGPHLPPLRYVLLGMNAHINFDLPQALLAVISDEEFDNAALIRTRAADHRHIDAILASRVAAEDEELKRVELPGDRTLLDRLLTPFNRLGTKRFLKEARAKVWSNAKRLSEARRQGPTTLQVRITELERLSQGRVADLNRPGQVLLELSRKGFGVLLE